MNFYSFYFILFILVVNTKRNCELEFYVFLGNFTPFLMRLCCSVSHSCLTLSCHGLQHASLPCPSPSPRVCSNSCPLSQWCHPTISSSVILFSSCLQSFPAWGSFLMSQFFTSGGQSIGPSASVLPVNIQDWFPLGLTGFILLLSKGLSRVWLILMLEKREETMTIS